jgi:hypothetical protein
VIQSDSKLLSAFPFIGHGNHDNNLESSGTFRTLRIPFRGRVIAQAVSRWLPTAAARVLERVRSCGIYGGQSGTGAGFLRVLMFPLPIYIPTVAP